MYRRNFPLPTSVTYIPFGFATVQPCSALEGTLVRPNRSYFLPQEPCSFVTGKFLFNHVILKKVMNYNLSGDDFQDYFYNVDNRVHCAG